MVLVDFERELALLVGIRDWFRRDVNGLYGRYMDIMLKTTEECAFFPAQTRAG